MSIFDEVEGIVKRTMILFFLVDRSGSMQGTKIGSVNRAIEDITPEIRALSDDNADASIKISVLTFCSGAEWMYDEPIPVENFQWKSISAGGVTDMGRAFTMLNEKLSRNAYMSDAGGSYAPAILLMSDGHPSDECLSALEKLKSNNWFKNAIRIAIAIGDDCESDILENFTGSSEAVFSVHNAEDLMRMIKLVTITSSKIGSASANIASAGTPEQTKQQQVVQQIQDSISVDMPSTDSDDW